MCGEPVPALRLVHVGERPELSAAKRLEEVGIASDHELNQGLRLMRAFRLLDDTARREEAISFVEALSAHKSNESG